MKKCLKNPYEIDKFGWDENSWNVMNMAMLTHFYHYLFFRLSKADIIHHFSMVAIAGSIEYYQQSIICPAVLFFLSGFPGSIDYFLLVFWNGQYYLMKHSLDYGKYLEIRKVEKLLWIEKNSPKYERNVISPKNERQALFT